MGATERGPPARPRAAARGHCQRRTSSRACRRPADSWASVRACASLGSRRGPRGVGEWGRARGGDRARVCAAATSHAAALWPGPRRQASALSPDSRPGPRAQPRPRERPGAKARLVHPCRRQPPLTRLLPPPNPSFWETADTDLEENVGSLVPGDLASGPDSALVTHPISAGHGSVVSKMEGCSIRPTVPWGSQGGHCLPGNRFSTRQPLDSFGKPSKC